MGGAPSAIGNLGMLRIMDRPVREVLSRPLAFATGAICLASLLAYGGRWSWFCDLLVNFRTHYALVLCPALILAIVFRHWRVAAVAVIGLALNAWPMAGTFVGPNATPAAGARHVRIVEFNVNIANENLGDIASYVDALKTDVVVLTELSPTNAAKLAELLPRLPYRHFAEKEGIWGVVILSRWPLIAPQTVMHDGIAVAARADVDLGDRRFRLYGAHLDWPVMPETARVRDAQLEALGVELSACPRACVAVGDFNVTPWSSHFRDLLKVPGVRDCAAGRGFLDTWAADLPAPLRIRIDQCLVAGSIGVSDVRIGHSVGSDHFAIISDFGVDAASPGH